MFIKIRFHGTHEIDLIDFSVFEDVITQADFIERVFTPLHPGATYAGFEMLDIDGLGLTKDLLKALNGCFEVMYQMAEAVEMVLSYYSVEALDTFIERFARLPADFGQFISLIGSPSLFSRSVEAC